MCNIFSTGGKFWPVSNFTELHALTLAAHFYALLSYWPKSRSTQVSFPGLHLPVLQGLGTTLLVLMLVSCLDHMGRRLHSQLSILYVVSQLWRKITKPRLTTPEFVRQLCKSSSCEKKSRSLGLMLSTTLHGQVWSTMPNTVHGWTKNSLSYMQCTNCSVLRHYVFNEL